MTPGEFQQAVAGDPLLMQAIGRVNRAGQTVRSFGGITDAAVVLMLFPIAKFVICEIGLPWLHELRRYSELQRQRVHDWIDSEYERQGFDPDQAEAASDALIEELEKTSDERTRVSWQRLAELMKSAGNEA